MGTNVSIILFLSSLAAGGLFEDGAYLNGHGGASTVVSANPASVPTAGSLTSTSLPFLERLELRQAPGLAPIGAAPPVNPTLPQPDPANPVVPVPINPDLANPGAAPVPPVAPAPNVPAVVAPLAPAVANPVNPALPLTTASTLALPGGYQDEFVRVQWMETWIGGTSQTWVPRTLTLQFRPWPTQAPLPGKGEVGMGTLTGEAGKTKTIVAGAAPTQAVGWMKGVAAAVGVGVVGVVV